MREALYYESQGQNLRCCLCPKGCVIGEGKNGFCRVRYNKEGKLYSSNYAACSASALDPIEKKPLYHFYPGSYILSLGTWGCNFSCRFCQNWQIAHNSPVTEELWPERAVEAAASLGRKNIGIAYTYSEPSVWYEYVLDTSRLAKEKGLKNVLVTNGFINHEPLSELLPGIDALNIDVKAFNDEFYREVCAGRLADVKKTVELAAKSTHVEITCLLVPGLNDSPDEITALAEWLGGINKNIPLHFSRYFPNYKMNIPATPPAALEMAYTKARRFLNYVYIGNLDGERVNTQCPTCQLTVINRQKGTSSLTANKKCPRCGSEIYIIGEVDF